MTKVKALEAAIEAALTKITRLEQQVKQLERRFEEAERRLSEG